jgi:hypothetical protein
MATTKGRLAEEILLVLSGGRIGAGTKFHPNEIKLSIAEVANQLLKMEVMTQDIPMGNMIPSGAAIGTYENNKVSQYGKVSKAKLPCFPLKLPRNMGVYQVIDSNGCELIPMELGQEGLIKSNAILNDLSGFIGYTCAGLDVLLTKDVTVPNTDVFLTFRLVVLDFTLYSDWDILPLSPEQEWSIKGEVIKLYGGEPVADKVVDSGNKEQRGLPLKTQEQP